jgi:hypothetical protein
LGAVFVYAGASAVANHPFHGASLNELNHLLVGGPDFATLVI